MTKWDVDSHFDVVIEIVRRKQSKDRKKHWTNEGYGASELSEERMIKKNQTFQILLEGNVEKDISTERVLQYQHNRENNSIVARVIIQDKIKEPQLNVAILKEEIASLNQKVIEIERMFGICKRQKTVIKQTEIIEYKGFYEMKVKCVFPKGAFTDVTNDGSPLKKKSWLVESEEEQKENERLQRVAASKNTELTYSVLNASSIQALCNCFSLDEAGMFALQMGLPISIKEELFRAQFPSKELVFRLLRIWSGTRHSRDRIKKILNGLATINRDDLVNAFDEAFREDLPFPENL